MDIDGVDLVGDGLVDGLLTGSSVEVFEVVVRVAVGVITEDALELVVCVTVRVALLVGCTDAVVLALGTLVTVVTGCTVVVAGGTVIAGFVVVSVNVILEPVEYVLLSVKV